jgi:2-oxoglutarate ferredoxin oxidoreductase subunit alpha
VSPGGGIIYDSSLKLTPESFGRDDIKLFPIPYMDLLIQALKEFGKERELSKYQVMVNTIALGASLGLVDYDFTLASNAIKEGFTGRKASLGDLNVSAAKRGYPTIDRKKDDDTRSTGDRNRETKGRMWLPNLLSNHPCHRRE